MRRLALAAALVPLVALGADNKPPLVVSPDSPHMSAFGSFRVSQEFPFISIEFPYNINTQVLTTTVANGGTVTQSNSKAVLQTTTATNGSAQLESQDRIRYIGGQGVVARLTGIFTACAASSTQELGVGDTTDGFFFACNGAAFSINRRQNGTDNYVAQTSWNVDKMDGTGPSGQTLTITNGNIFQIQYQWLGFGEIRFLVESAASGTPVLVHRIQYANANTNPSIFNPSLPLHLRVVNSGNATNLTLQSASIAAATEGPPFTEAGNRQSFTNSKAAIPTTGLSVFTLQNRATFNAITNRSQIRVDSVSVTDMTGSSNAYVELIKNTTLGGTPSFTNVNTNSSIAATDTAGTTVTGGQILFIYNVAGAAGNGTGNPTTVDLSAQRLYLNPSDTMTCAVFSESGTITGRCSLSWQENF